VQANNSLRTNRGILSKSQTKTPTKLANRVINMDDAASDLYQKVEMKIDDEKEKLPTEQMDNREFSFDLSQNDLENS
jgi:signal recognition particle GTPase